MAQEDEGWIEWNGGDRPVERGMRVDARLRGGDTMKRRAASGLDWSHWGSEGDIIAYRVVKP
jgi:hypothetical protein